jgi:hypothetical protein
MIDDSPRGGPSAAKRPSDEHAARPGLSPVEVWRRLEHATGTPGFSPVAKAAAERAWMKILKATGAKA